jgi:hypothetical protein
MDEAYSPCFFGGAGRASSSEDKTAAAAVSPVPFPLISESNIASEDTSLTEISYKYKH